MQPKTKWSYDIISTQSAFDCLPPATFPLILFNPVLQGLSPFVASHSYSGIGGWSRKQDQGIGSVQVREVISIPEMHSDHLLTWHGVTRSDLLRPVLPIRGFPSLDISLSLGIFVGCSLLPGIQVTSILRPLLTAWEASVEGFRLTFKDSAIE